MLKGDADLEAFLADGRRHDLLVARPDLASINQRYTFEPALEVGAYAYGHISGAPR